MTHEEDLKRVGCCQGKGGECACGPYGNRDFGDENDYMVKATNPQFTVEFTPPESGDKNWVQILNDSVLGSRHPNSERFHRLLKEAGELHDRKQADYGKGDDPFANVRSSTDWGMPAWVGAMVRLNDKVKRLQKLAKTGGLANESAIDSFMDIAVYALIARVLYEEET